jgi:hypothetical protein
MLFEKKKKKVRNLKEKYKIKKPNLTTLSYSGK